MSWLMPTTNNILCFGAGYLLREFVLRSGSGVAKEIEETGILEKLLSLFQSTPEKLTGACGYVFYQPDAPLRLDQTVEACVSDLESALNAWKGGANSLELCADRPQGGVTPSSSFIESVARTLRSRGAQINVLVRPRPGSFVYSTPEFEILTAEIRMAKEAGATGIVAGVLHADGYIHQPRMELVKTLCSNLGLQLTFHRAFDVCADTPDTALDFISKLGCERLLTSGRKDAVTDGEALQLVEKLQRMSKGTVQIVAAAGIKPDNVASVILATKVRAVHCGSGITSKVVHNHAVGRKEDFTSDKDLGLNAPWEEVDRAKAALLVENAFSCWSSLALVDDEPATADPIAEANAVPASQDGVNSYVVIADDHESIQEHSDSPAPGTVKDRISSA